MTDTEDRLRRALGAAGDAITAEPRQFTIADAPAPTGGSSDVDAAGARRLRRRSWELWLTIAAVLALGVAGGVVGLADHSRHNGSPVAVDPTVAPVGRIHAQTCTVALPAAWRDQLRADTVIPAGSSGARAGLIGLGTDAEGYTLAADTTTTPQSIDVIRPDRSVHRIWQLPKGAGPGAGTDPAQGFAPANSPAAVDGRWVVFALRQTSGADQPPFDFYAANTRTGTVRQLTPRTDNTRYALDAPVAVDGSVYFSATSSDNGLGVGPGFIYAYDLATGRRRILDHGVVGRVRSAGGGVYWQHGRRTVNYLAASLPPGYQTRGSSMITDGTREAWIQQISRTKLTIQMRDGTATPVTVLSGFSIDNYPQIMALSGPYLVVSDNTGLTAFDTRSGAVTRLGGTDDFAASGAGQIAITIAAGGTHLVVIAVADLPTLTC